LEYHETPEDFLRREIMEEMGLEIKILSERPTLILTSSSLSGSPVLNVMYDVEFINLNFRKSNECCEVGFFSPMEMLKLSAYRNVKELGEKL
jgi:8-oxo-dGTP pyrophosphatase MutT (NUDIX family)